MRERKHEHLATTSECGLCCDSYQSSQLFHMNEIFYKFRTLSMHIHRFKYRISPDDAFQFFLPNKSSPVKDNDCKNNVFKKDFNSFREKPKQELNGIEKG